MPRYIDADKLIEFITAGLNNPDKTTAFGYDAIDILAEIECEPTADVVPKSEVEKAKKDAEKWAAREIFKEIRELVKPVTKVIYNGKVIYESPINLNEIEKKYTEDK